MKLILHIGVEKTGSTSLQLSLLSNRDTLIENGFYFPSDSHLLDQYNGNFIGLCLLTNSKKIFLLGEHASDTYKTLPTDQYQSEFEKNFCRICEESRNLGCHTMILSNEHCSSRLDSFEINFLHKFFLKYFENIQVLLYLREQSDAYRSLYSTHVKSGGIMRFNQIEFLSTTHIYPDFMYNYQKLLSRWVNVCGEKNVVPKIYCKNTFHDFSNHLGLSLSLMERGEVRNRS